MNALINSRMRRAGTSPFVVFLLSGILLTLVALVLVIVLRPGSEGAAPGKPKRESVKDKAIKTRGDLEREGSSPAKPSGTVDKSRIVQTYRQGYTYRSLLKIALTARASSKDWGIVNDTTLHYLAEAELLRMIESNDGTTVMLVQEFRRARTLSIWSKIEGIRLELGLPAHLLLEAGGTFYGLTPGWTRVSVDAANSLLSDPTVKQLINTAAEDPDMQIGTLLDSLEGKKVKITYVNGTGVTAIQPLGCDLSADEQDLIFNSSVVFDAYILPNPECKEGDTWTIQGSDLAQLVDPSLRSTISGSLTARRGRDGGTPERPTAEIVLDSGILELHSTDRSTESMAKWAPKGSMIFSFHDRIVTSSQLKGEFLVEQHSLDHLLFEARFSVAPEYLITYSCDVMR